MARKYRVETLAQNSRIIAVFQRPKAGETTIMMPSTISGIFAVIFYLATVYLLARAMLSNSRRPLPAISTAILALAAHGLMLFEIALADGMLSISFYHVLSQTSWLISCLLFSACFFKPMLATGLAFYPIAALSVALDLAFGHAGVGSESMSWQIKMHVILALFAYAVLSLAAVQALVLAVHEYALRHTRYIGITRVFPPLQIGEHLLFQLITGGFVLLSLAMLVGILFVQDLFAQRLAHKTVLSAISWLVFGTLLWGRYRWGWRGRTAIRFTLSGMVLLILAFFGSKFVLELILASGR